MTTEATTTWEDVERLVEERPAGTPSLVTRMYIAMHLGATQESGYDEGSKENWVDLSLNGETKRWRYRSVKGTIEKGSKHDYSEVIPWLKDRGYYPK